MSLTPETWVRLCYRHSLKPRLHQATCCLLPCNMLPVSRQHVSLCIQQQTGNKLATILLPSTYCLLPATCCLKQHVAGNKQHVEGNMLPSNMFPGVNAAIVLLVLCICDVRRKAACLRPSYLVAMGFLRQNARSVFLRTDPWWCGFGSLSCLQEAFRPSSGRSTIFGGRPLIGWFLAFVRFFVDSDWSSLGFV